MTNRIPFSDRPISNVLMIVGVPNPDEDAEHSAIRAENARKGLSDAGVTVEIASDGRSDVDMDKLARIAAKQPDRTLVIINAHGDLIATGEHGLQLRRSGLTPTAALLRSLSRGKDFDYMALSCYVGQVHGESLPQSGTVLTTSSDDRPADSEDIDVFFEKMSEPSFTGGAVSLRSLLTLNLMESHKAIPPAVSLCGQGYCNLGDMLESKKGHGFSEEERRNVCNAFAGRYERQVNEVLPIIEEGYFVGKRIISAWSGPALAIALAAYAGQLALNSVLPKAIVPQSHATASVPT